MRKSALIKYCLFDDDAILTYPWSDARYSDIAVVRHKSNEKWFVLVFELNGILCINLKCQPENSVILREMHDFITPAWHMNKTHWIKVDVNKCPKELLINLIKNSFEITG